MLSPVDLGPYIHHPAPCIFTPTSYTAHLASYDLTAIHIADVDVIKALIGAGASLEADGGGAFRRPLENAIADGNVEVVKVLIEAGASLEAAGEDELTPLEYSIHDGNADVIHVLKEADHARRERALRAIRGALGSS